MTMSDIEDQTDIIDISSEDIVEHKPDEKVASSKPSRNRAKIGVAALLVVASAVGGGWLYREFLSSYLPSDQNQAIMARVDALEATTKTLGGKLDAVVGFSDEIKSQLGAALSAAAEAKKQSGVLKQDSVSTKNSMATLEKSLAVAIATVDDLKSKITTGGPPQTTTGGDLPALASRVDTLEKDVAGLKAAGGTAKADTVILSQSLSDLKAKVAQGAPFADEVGRIARIVPAAEGLDVLTAQASLGLPNAQGLSAELKAIIPSLPKSGVAPAAQDGSWWGSAVTMMSGLITIKESGVADWQQLATQCAAFADQGDLKKSILTLEQAEGALPVDLQKWHDKAAARLALEQAMEKASAAVVREIAAKG